MSWFCNILLFCFCYETCIGFRSGQINSSVVQRSEAFVSIHYPGNNQLFFVYYNVLPYISCMSVGDAGCCCRIKVEKKASNWFYHNDKYDNNDSVLFPYPKRLYQLFHVSIQSDCPLLCNSFEKKGNQESILDDMDSGTDIYLLHQSCFRSMLFRYFFRFHGNDYSKCHYYV